MRNTYKPQKSRWFGEAGDDECGVLILDFPSRKKRIFAVKKKYIFRPNVTFSGEAI